MRLLHVTIRDFRSIHSETVKLDELTLFIGANASGKSTILDVLRFLHEGVRARDFRVPVITRGGILNLAWKGSPAGEIMLEATLEDAGKQFEWSVRLIRQEYEFNVEEHVRETSPDAPPTELLYANKGVGWWWSRDRQRVSLKQSPTTCALSAASADASFPAREVAEFVGRWGFFDPNPFLLRRDWIHADSGRFDPHGRNLGETLYALSKSSPAIFNSVISATRSIVGLPSELEPRESEDRFYFVQEEPGLMFPVNQMGVSSGTLRMLALMTALYAQPETTLIGIEEPENYVHPSALAMFVEHIMSALDRVHFMITTHSPLLLDVVDDPSMISVVRNDSNGGTTVLNETAADRVREALDASGFGLGEYYETKGFGG